VPVTVEDVRRLALSLPGTTEHLIRDRVKFRVKQLVYVAFSRDETLMGFGFPREQRAALVESEPDKFLLPSQGDMRYQWVVARMAADGAICAKTYYEPGFGAQRNLPLPTVEMVKTHLNQDLEVSTILITMYDSRTNLAAGVAAEVRDHFSGQVLRTSIPRSVRVSEAPSYGQSVMTYDPGSPGALSYLEAARELARRGAGTHQEGTR